MTSRLCACGCGGETPLAKRTSAKLGLVQGMPVRFIPGHQNYAHRGERSPSWRGGRRDFEGYVMLHTPGHPRANRGYVFEHILVVERAMGKYLRPDAQVHHVDEDRSNNDPSNLVACDGLGYHKLLHRRMRALLASGDPNALPCKICGSYDRQEEISSYVARGKDAGRVVSYHLSCNREHSKKRGKVA